MTGSVQWLGVGSAEELVRLLPGVIEEEGHHTFLYNRARWRDDRQVASAVRGTFGLVADNDGTVIRGSQWVDLRRRLLDAFRPHDEADTDAYFRGDRSDAGDVALLLRLVERLAASGVTRAHLREDAARQEPRAGTRALFDTYGRDATAIVSYGVEAYIAEWSAAHGIPVREIHAARLTWRPRDDDHVVAGCERDTVVIASNKGRAREAFSHRLHLDGHEVMVLEDTPHMLAGMKHPNNVGVLVVPRRDPQPFRVAARMRELANPELFGAIDLMLVSDSLEPLVSLRR